MISTSPGPVQAGPEGKRSERTLLVHQRSTRLDDLEDLNELELLAVSAGADVQGTVLSSRQRPDPATYIGKGKAEELAERVKAEDIELVLVNHDLSPAQERNLEKIAGCRVLDRTGLILDIFAQRARSHEGKLQVELAQLEHLSTRLVRGWTHLERQKGGIGLRGPGETQLETDRRLLRERIKYLNKRLQRVTNQRQIRRRSRNKIPIPTVSLVGYTNAGKSTLFNALTESRVYAADQLFATLDPTLRRIELPEAEPVILADTVGFIRHLPHQLVAAFQSTLEETREADLLLHLIDATDEEKDEHKEEVHKVLKEIGALEVPRIEVCNKVDMLEDFTPRIDRDAAGFATRVWISAATGAGLDLLRQVLAEAFRDRVCRTLVQIPVNAGRLRARFYEYGVVISERVLNEQYIELDVEMREKYWHALRKDSEFAGLMICPDDGKCLAGAA